MQPSKQTYGPGPEDHRGCTAPFNVQDSGSKPPARGHIGTSGHKRTLVSLPGRARQRGGSAWVCPQKQPQEATAGKPAVSVHRL